MWVFSFLAVPLSPQKLTVRELYASYATALHDALRHAVERGGMSSLGVLHRGVSPPTRHAGNQPINCK
jgi:hypothetical protein